MWHSLESFHDQSAHQREVVDTVLQERADIHSLDAKDIVFQVCDLMRECVCVWRGEEDSVLCRIAL